MKLGCHAVLFRDRVKTETEEVLRNLASTGFKGVEIGSRFFGTEDKQRLVSILNHYGLELSGMHVGCPLKDWMENEAESITKVLSVAAFVKNLPNKNVIMSGGGLNGYDVKAVASGIEKAAQQCLTMGVRLNYHNHALEFENNAEIFNALVEHAPSLYFALDLGWVYKGGFDPVEIINKIAGRTFYVHLRDAQTAEGKVFNELGDGNFDYPRLMETLGKALGDDGWAVVEYEEGEQNAARYTAARKFLLELGY